MSSGSTAAQDEQPQVTLEEALTLAQGHHKEGNFILAERTYRDILRAVPDHFPTTQYLGFLLFQNGQFEDAAQYLKKAVDAQPEDANCWNNYGGVLTQMGRNEEALEIYKKCLTLKPDHLDALNNTSYALWLLGRYEEAEKAARDTLAIHEDNLSAVTNLGMALARQNKYSESILMWEKASEINPDDPKAWINWGNTLREAGYTAESAEKCRKAVELDPKNPEALNNLANALRDTGKFSEAQELYKKATDIRPDYPEAHNNLAIAYIDESNFERAAVSARYAVAFKHDFAEGFSALSVAEREQGHYNEAFSAAQQSVALQPEKPDPYFDIADVLLMTDRLDDAEAAVQEGLKREDEASVRSYSKLATIRERQNRPEDAVEEINKAIELAPDMVILYMTKAHLLTMANEAEQAFEAIDKAIELAPDWVPVLSQKAEMLVNVNENEQAIALCRQAIEMDPNLPGPYQTLTALRQIKSEDAEEFQRLKSMVERIEKQGLSQSASINFAMAAAYEQFKDYDKAFEHLKKANDARRQTLPYDSSQAPESYEGLKRAFSPEFFAQYEGKGYESDVPVFILGMPRSGTTLTEQIISSHPDVFGAGELTDLSKAKQALQLTPENAAAIGEDYVRRIQERNKDGKALRVTDKMPGNFMQIGFIHCILPNAKIIHCRRDPIDTCLSSYKQNFVRGQYWSYDLEEMGGEYLRYLDIMEYWRTVLPDSFLEIDYEETVANFEEQAHKLIDFVGLPWDDACLEPHKQKRNVLTASKAQVTRPIYNTSVQKWKKFEKQLQPLVRILKPDEALPVE